MALVAEVLPVTRTRASQVRLAKIHLKMACDLLVKADAPRAAAEVRRAIDSAEGAERYAHHPQSCTEISL